MGRSSSSQTTVLIVEDNKTNHRLLESLLSAEGYKTISAWDGGEGLAMLNQHRKKIDVVLLDLRMPRVSGIDFLEMMRQDSQYDSMPVIVQTADRSEEALRQVAAFGVYFFLTKPIDVNICRTVVKNAIEDAQKTKKAFRQANRSERSFSLIKNGEFQFRTEAEALILAACLSKICSSPRRQILGLSELMVNAVQHGNLAISQIEKINLIEKNNLDEEIKKRLKTPPFSERIASIKIDQDEEGVRFEISDEGDGFDWRKEIANMNEKILKPSRRGIALAHKIGFDKIKYIGNGSTVIAHAYKDKEKMAIQNEQCAVEELVPVASPRTPFEVEQPLVTAANMQMRYLPDEERLSDIKEKYGMDLTFFLYPSEELGGDHWGVIPIDEQRLAIFIIDFSSDGSIAAADTIWLDGAIWNIINNEIEPAEMLSELNASMIKRSPNGNYATMLFGIIDTTKECLTYSTAGAPLPVILSTDLKKGNMTEGKGLPLGAVPNAPYKQHQIEFSQGETLILYSDGVIENPNSQGSIVGRAQAAGYFGKIASWQKKDLTAQHFLNCFLTNTKQPPNDDSTLICCRYVS